MLFTTASAAAFIPFPSRHLTPAVILSVQVYSIYFSGLSVGSVSAAFLCPALSLFPNDARRLYEAGTIS